MLLIMDQIRIHNSQDTDIPFPPEKQTTFNALHIAFLFLKLCYSTLGLMYLITAAQASFNHSNYIKPF